MAWAHDCDVMVGEVWAPVGGQVEGEDVVLDEALGHHLCHGHGHLQGKGLGLRMDTGQDSI